MRTKKAIIRILIVVMVAILGIGSIIPSLAVTNEEKNLTLSYFRYVNGNPTYGYKIQTTGQHDSHPIFQILSNNRNESGNSAYYCLSALYGYSWNGAMNENASTTNEATYTQYYNLDSSSDIEQLAGSTKNEYSSIAGSHLKQILWILDNIYIPNQSDDAEENITQKNTLLSKAGIVYETTSGTHKAYKYRPVSGYDYRSKLNSNETREIAEAGWDYYDNDDNYVSLDITDDVMEISQQLALWYYTNHLENNSSNDQSFNFKDYKVELYRGVYGTDNPFSHWNTIDGYKYIDSDNIVSDLGLWIEDQVTILTSYLIDAANNYATTSNEVAGNPLTLTPQPTTDLSENTNYYVVGPITISETKPAKYDLNNTISINGDTTTGAYISDNNGNRSSNQTIVNYIGQPFYISIPKSKITGNSIDIEFDGKYYKNTKKLWVNETVGEQPIVEVKPEEEPFKLNVNANISKQKEFDLALRKAITKITSADGTTKMIINENGANAERRVTVDTSTIPNTATYKHRKDPVVVEKGDIVTYSITIYNEGEMAGYAKTIVDELPFGLVPKNRTGTYRNGNVNYSYEYYPWEGGNDRIIFTNVSNNELAPYNGQNTLSSETIEIECEVTQEPSSSTNTYLTNIAYISGAYNTETSEDVVQDRDSSTNNNPSATQNTTGDKYTGYHGGNNNNGDNTKNVYNDGTNNDDYFPGREDDDDFEIIVLKPAEFDLALQKYIDGIIPENLAFDGTIKNGRNAPTIDTTKLANGTATTATYIQDKTPIKVKSGDYVLYNFTVYNEGQIDGYVKKITDNIPTGLEFVYAKEPKDGKTVIKCDSQGNMEEIEVSSGVYQWVEMNSLWSIDATNNAPKKDTYNGESTISITCDVSNWGADDIGLGSPGFVKAYDSSKDVNRDGTGLSSTGVRVLLRVSAPNGEGVIIRNEAAITEATDKDGNIQDVTDLRDRDSQTNQWPGKDGDKNYQDDEDYDNIILGKVDIALTKFIIAISDDIRFEDGEYLTRDTTSTNAGSTSNPYTRQTAVDTTPLKNGGHDAIYT